MSKRRIIDEIAGYIITNLPLDEDREMWSKYNTNTLLHKRWFLYTPKKVIHPYICDDKADAYYTLKELADKDTNLKKELVDRLPDRYKSKKEQEKNMIDSARESILAVACEVALPAKERNALPDDVFGLPDSRKYPLDTEDRLKSAISYFHYCPEKDRKVLATNIMNRIKKMKWDVQISDKSLIHKYL